MNLLMIILTILLYLKYFQICVNQRKPVKTMVINCLLGVFLLTALSFATSFSGEGIAVNYATVAISSLLGLPGVIMVYLICFWI